MFTINAAASGFRADGVIGPLAGFPLVYYSTASLTTYAFPPASWIASFSGFYVGMDGATSASIGPGDLVTHAMTVDRGTVYRPVYDAAIGAITGREEIGTAVFSPFSSSGAGFAYRNLQGQLIGCTLSVNPGPFESFLRSVDFVFNGSGANDIIYADAFGGYGNTATLNGGGGDDFLQGSNHAANTIFGGPGNDDLRIQSDLLHTSPVTHDVYGGSGADSIFVYDAPGDRSNLFGGSGNDILVGAQDGDYTMTGGPGNDLLNSANGGVAVFSGRRADYAVFHNGYNLPAVQDRRAASPDGTDQIVGLDRLRFSDGTFTLASLLGFGVTVTGGSGADVITPAATVAGQAFPSRVIDTLYGNGGDDVLDGGLGADVMYGGAGNDTYYVEDAGDQVIEIRATGGVDTVVSSLNGYTLGAFVENLTLANVAGLFVYTGTGNGLANILRGNALANVLSGGDGDDQLFGGGGNDFLEGGPGDDRLDGNAGADVMFGGGGDDTYVVDDPGDVAAENEGGAAGGADTVLSTVTFDLAASGDFVENLTLLGTAAIDGAGNAAANVLTGNAAANRLSGLGGSDVLRGGGGPDVLIGGDGADVLAGDRGADRFVFTDAAHSVGAARDRIVAGDGAPAFEGVGVAGGDLIDVSAIDADETTPGDQAFTFGGAGVGTISVVDLGSDTLVRGNTDADPDFEFELLIADGGVLASAYRDVDFVL